MKKIFIDIQPIIKHRTGIGWYTYKTISEVLNLSQKNFEFWATCFDFLGRNKSENLLSQENFHGIKIQKLIPNTAYRKTTNIININYDTIFRGGDIYHFCNFIIPPISNTKKVLLNVYDMVYKKFPETMKESNLKILNKHMDYSINRADHILTISNSAKNDILEYYNIDERKISVLPPGIDLSFYTQSKTITKEKESHIKNKYGLPNKFFLFLGTLEPRKNLNTVLKAYSILPPEIKQEYKLVLSGIFGWKTEEHLNLLKKLNLVKHVVYTGYIDEIDKPYIYFLASIFLFPSIYEGFGMPIIEALASGTPVIASNTSSLPEAGGNGCSYVSPFDYEKISQEIQKYIYDTNYSNEKLKHGSIHINNFSWKENAIKILNTYNSLSIT